MRHSASMSEEANSITDTEAEKNGRHFAEDVFICIFSNENVLYFN